MALADLFKKVTFSAGVDALFLFYFFAFAVSLLFIAGFASFLADLFDSWVFALPDFFEVFARVASKIIRTDGLFFCLAATAVWLGAGCRTTRCFLFIASVAGLLAHILNDFLIALVFIICAQLLVHVFTIEVDFRFIRIITSVTSVLTHVSDSLNVAFLLISHAEGRVEVFAV